MKHQRNLQHIYRAAMSALLENQDLREVTARRELYRRLARTGDELVAGRRAGLVLGAEADVTRGSAWG